jgi:hypothetical protein
MSTTDKPDYQHPEYQANIERWKRCRDAVSGQDAVHAGGKKYLPKLPGGGETDEEYMARKLGTPYFNASGRTVEGMVGLVFRKAPVYEIPPSMEAIEYDMTMTGSDMTSFSKRLITEIEVVGRVGVLVEYPTVPVQPVTEAQRAALNLRPYASMYKAETIINWRIGRINNQLQPVLVVLSETFEDHGQFETAYKPQLRVLELSEGAYVQTIWRKTDKGEWAVFDKVMPIMNGSPLHYIPFQIIGANSLEYEVAKPPLIDLVDINLAHYINSSFLERGANFTGSPFVFIAGIQLEKDQSIKIGSPTAIVAPDPSANAQFVEFHGTGLGTLENLLNRKESQMAAIGARMLAPEKSGVEAAQAMEIKRAGETSVLASHANTVSEAMEAILNWLGEWMGIDAQAEFELNTDYLPVNMTAQEITALVSAWQSGAISKQDLFYNLQQGEIIQPGKTYEEQQDESESEAPSLGMMSDANGE